MFVDARTLPPDARLDFDLCIVGAGAAGITLAQALAGTGRRVALVESGGFDFDPAVQDLYAGESVGINYRIQESRLRYFGGSTNHWHGFCRPLDEIDFVDRDWMPQSGWPFGSAELEPYYRRARPICDLEPLATATDEVRRAGGSTEWSGPLETSIYQLSPPTRFGTKFRATLATAAGIRVMLNASLLDLGLAADGAAIAEAKFGTLAGSRFAVTARRYVLACGGLENARLLLLTSGEGRSNGIGNHHDLVGRFFAEHPQIRVGALLHSRPAGPRFDHSFKTTAGYAREGFRLSDAAQRASRTTNIDFHPLFMADLAKAPEMAALNPAIQSLASRLRGSDPARESRHTTLWSTAEQSPNPDSRITLAESRDAFGLRRLRLDWRLSDLERHSFVTAARILALEAGRQQVGRVWMRPAFRSLLSSPPGTSGPDTPDQLRRMVGWGCHHMGTTRMHADARRGVVDATCRVHGVDNLYIAGSSTFPNSGVSNPTLTIVALALRLADHLARS